MTGLLPGSPHFGYLPLRRCIYCGLTAGMALPLVELTLFYATPMPPVPPYIWLLPTP